MPTYYNAKRRFGYINRPVDSDSYLIHGEWKKHKYIAKVKMKNGKYRYFYSQEEYNSYLKGNNKKKDTFDGIPIVSDIFSLFSNAGKAVSGILDKPVSALKAVASNVTSFINNKIAEPVTSFAQDVVSNGQKFVESLVSDGMKDHKYVARIRTASGKYRYFYSDEEYQRYLQRQEYQENEPGFMKDVPEYDGEMSMSDNAEEVNPDYPYGEDFSITNSSEDNSKAFTDEMLERGYDPNDPEDQKAYIAKYYPYSVNCSLCTLTYEMRERGYDVEAKPNGYVDEDYVLRDMWHTDVDWISTVYENVDSKSYGSNKYDETVSSNKYDILDDISKEPVGSRGEIAVFWTNGGGHSVAYTVGDNHEITVRDTQTNDTYTIEDLLELSDYIRYTRTDNLEFSEECLQYVEYDDDDD